MLHNIPLQSRILTLVAVPTFFLIVVGVASQVGVHISDRALEKISSQSDLQAISARLAETVHSGLITTVHQLEVGSLAWETAEQRLFQARRQFDRDWKKLGRAAGGGDESDGARSTAAKASLDTAFSDLAAIHASRNRELLELFVINDFENLVAPVMAYLEQEQRRRAMAVDEAIAGSRDNTQQLLIATGVASLTAILIALVSGHFVWRSIDAPLRKIVRVVRSVSDGDFSARTGLHGSDELSLLGQAYDRLLDDRSATVAEVERENESLNNSVIALLQAVAQLAQRDLTVSVPVAADVTGAVADALNLLTQETANVLQGVTNISVDVASASAKVKAKSESVLALAATERQQVLTAARELNATAEALQKIAELAGHTNEAAESAIAKTRLALDSVVSTVDGINSSRDTIRETEKRIKRLGERSQEISVAVNLINNIAERTHILALNASMHAASAGEAGRGFAVVADEVQRLAENARQATSQIANLVTNIQAETADTVAAMNSAIGQVVEGSRLAEEAGERMRETQDTTAQLVAAVREIAASSHTQAQSSQTLREHARQIETSTKETSEMLNVQAQHTNRLVQYAKRLIASVQVFRLPESKGIAEEVLDKAA